MLALCVNAKCAGEILNFFSALLTVFFLPILPCNTFVTHAVAMPMSSETLRRISARCSHRAYESTPITEALWIEAEPPKIVCPAL